MVLLTNMACTQSWMLAVWDNGGEPPGGGRSRPLNSCLPGRNQSAPGGTTCNHRHTCSQSHTHTHTLPQVKRDIKNRQTFVTSRVTSGLMHSPLFQSKPGPFFWKWWAMFCLQIWSFRSCVTGVWKNPFLATHTHTHTHTHTIFLKMKQFAVT